MSIETFVELLKKNDLELDYSLTNMKEESEVEKGEDPAFDFLVEKVEKLFFNPEEFYFFGLEDLIDEDFDQNSDLYKLFESVGLEDWVQFFGSYLKYEGATTFKSEEPEDDEADPFSYEETITQFSGDGIIVLVRSYSDCGGSFEEVLVSLK